MAASTRWCCLVLTSSFIFSSSFSGGRTEIFPKAKASCCSLARLAEHEAGPCSAGVGARSCKQFSDLAFQTIGSEGRLVQMLHELPRLPKAREDFLAKRCRIQPALAAEAAEVPFCSSLEICRTEPARTTEMIIDESRALRPQRIRHGLADRQHRIRFGKIRRRKTCLADIAPTSPMNHLYALSAYQCRCSQTSSGA